MNIIDQIKILICDILDSIHYITVFGEWAGKGVQPKVAISELPKTFYMFGVNLTYLNGDTIWLSSDIISKIQPPPHI